MRRRLDSLGVHLPDQGHRRGEHFLEWLGDEVTLGVEPLSKGARDLDRLFLARLWRHYDF